MRVVTSAVRMKEIATEIHRQGGKIAFVPTMGSLHEGHLALIREAKKQGGQVVVSLFVNPKQFNEKGDFEKYPRDPEGDHQKLKEVGVDIAFSPTLEEIYPPGETGRLINLPPIARPLEGRFRPGHFQGVVQVVSRLFEIVQPQLALFGLKDYQQLRVIEEMVRARKLPVTILPCPIVRSKEGLALSSRNARLSDKGKKQALALFQSLERARTLFQKGERRASAIETEVQKTLGDAGLSFDYATVVDAQTLQDVVRIDEKSLLAIAAFVEGIRLIDNCLLDPNKL